MDKETLQRLQDATNTFLRLHDRVLAEAADCHEFRFDPYQLQPLREAFFTVLAIAAPGVECEVTPRPAWEEGAVITLRMPKEPPIAQNRA